MHHTERLKACLQRVICDPAFPLAELDAWFTPDYCQEVNGERLDYPAFHQHIATLRTWLPLQNLHNMSIGRFQRADILALWIAGTAQKRAMPTIADHQIGSTLRAWLIFLGSK